MDFPPLITQINQIGGQGRHDAAKRLHRKPEVLSLLHRPRQAVQPENRFTPVADHMNMRWPVIVGIDHHTEPTDAFYCWHAVEYIHNPICLG